MTQNESATSSGDAARIRLLEPRLGRDHSFADAIAARRTTRQMTDRALDEQTLSNLLFAASGVNRTEGPFGVPGLSAATASNSQEVELYVALERGAYRYARTEHELVRVSSEDLRPLAFGPHQQPPPSPAAPVQLVFVADVAKLEHSAGFDEPGLHDPEIQKSYYFVDTGIIAENVYLFAASEGLACWFHHCDRARLARALGLGPTQRVLFAQTVGYPEQAPQRDERESSPAATRELEQRIELRTEELRAANRRLETLTKQLQTALRITNVGSWELDVASGQVTWSDELFRIFGMSPSAEAPNLAMHPTLFEEESWARLSSALEHSRVSGDGYELMLTALRVDGARRTAIARAETLRNAAGEVERMVGTFQDVSAHEQAARDLEQLSNRLQLATSSAKIGVWEWNIVTDEAVWDETMWQIYQTPRSGPMTYARFRSSLHPDDGERFERELRAALEGRQEFATTVRIVRPDGSERHLRSAAAFEYDASGRPVRMIGVNWDITEQWAAESALRKSEALQRAILSHAGSAIIAATPSGVVTVFNRAAEELLGYRAEEVIGIATPELFHDPAEIAARKRTLERELGTQIDDFFEVFLQKARCHAPDANEWTYVRKDGGRVPVLLTVTTVRDSASAIVGYLGLAFDLTQRKAEESELLELNKLLGQRTKQMEVLLQEVHHRVKNNLQMIASLVSMQARQLGDSAARAALADCRTRVLAIATIHEQLYQSSDYSRVPFSDYVKRLARDVFSSSVHASRQIELVGDVESVALPVEQAIPCGLILNELLTNALKHAFPNERRGTVQLGLHVTSGDEVTLSVTDDGVGLPAELSPGSGHALGMQLVFDLVQQLHGRVEITRTPSTRISVTFPLAPQGVSS